MSDPVNAAIPVGALLQVEKLNSAYQVKGFKSGKNSLDVFLKRHALKNQEADSSQTYVVHRGGRGRLLFADGWFSGETRVCAGHNSRETSFDMRFGTLQPNADVA